MAFILVGATLGVVVLSVLLFWPSSPPEVAPSAGRRPVVPNAPTRVKPQPPPSSPTPVITAPAHLVIKGLPDSRVLLDFKDSGYIPAGGELALDAPCPGTGEWSVHVKVVKDGYGEYSTRALVRAGAPAVIDAEQPSNSKRHKH
jgi:hypothetical protein